jgi:hypothetical protein
MNRLELNIESLTIFAKSFILFMNKVGIHNIRFLHKANRKLFPSNHTTSKEVHDVLSYIEIT